LNKPPTSLARKHALVWAILLSSLLGLSGGIGAWFAWRDTLAALEVLQRERAVAAAERIGQFLTAVEQPLRWVVDDPALTSADSLDALYIELLQLLRRLPALGELRWIDGDGLERLTVSRLALDAMDSRRNFSSDPRFVVARQRGEFIGRVNFQRESEPTLVLALAAPRGGQVLVAEISLKSALASNALQREDTQDLVYVVDAEGRLISHPDLGLVLRKTEMASLGHVRAALAAEQPMSMLDGRNLSGNAVLAAAAPIRRLGWTVFVEQDRALALAPVWRALLQSALLVAVGLVVSVVASVLLARRMAQPIRRLQERAAAIGAGRFYGPIDLKTGDELQALAEQFDQMASNLQSSYATLERRVAERTHELAAANEAKSRFLAAASHDLRQPVHALGLFVGQLRAAPAGARQRELITHIESSVAAFESLLESLLDISRLDAGTVAVHRESLALAPLLQRIGAGFEAAAQQKGLRLHVRPQTLWVDSDPVLLERILTNLLANAIRYTRRGRVLLGCRRRGAGVELVVADTGVGIAAEQLPLVFREFHRVPGAAPEGDPGLGLGLAIVQRLADLLDHELRLRSAPGRGSCFTLLLPRADPVAAALSSDAWLAPPTEVVLVGRDVLVVDDDAVVCEAVRGQLAQWGCTVRTAASAAQAMAAFGTPAWPDLVIADLRLAEGEDGLALAQRLRQISGGRVPVVIVSGETDPARLQAVREAGFAVLAKPLRPARLRALLESLLASAGTDP
jgi:signal transduction histidine kinase/CheY-like chemotaxis protein